MVCDRLERYCAAVGLERHGGVERRAGVSKRQETSNAKETLPAFDSETSAK